MVHAKMVSVSAMISMKENLVLSKNASMIALQLELAQMEFASVMLLDLASIAQLFFVKQIVQEMENA